MNYVFAILIATFSGISISDCEVEKTDKEMTLVSSVEGEKKAFVRILTEQLSASHISADAGWEVFSNLIDGELRDKMFIYLNILSEIQKINEKNHGFQICAKGVFLRDCSIVLSVSKQKLLTGFSKQKGSETIDQCASIDARALFLGLHNGAVERMRENK